MIDLRKSDQRYNGYYIWKEKKGYAIGKNGTSKHTFISKKNKSNKQIKSEILNFIKEW
jgi:hypothetical protein